MEPTVNPKTDEAHADAILARCQVGEGKISDGQKAIERAVSLTKKSQDRGARLLIRIEDARVSSASGKTLQASRTLQSVVTEAARTRLLPIEFEARLALGEVEIKSGHSSQGKTRLSGLQQEAASKGFGLIAGKASAALK